MPILPGAEPFGHDGSTEIGVLLCHGFTGSPQSMAPWGARLAEAGVSTMCPLLPGHGTTWQDMNRTTWQQWYVAVETAFAVLSRRCDSVFVFGLSMGGTLALRLAQERGGEVAGLVLVNPSVTTERRDAVFLPLLSRLVPSMPGIAGDVKKPGVTELAYGRLPLRAATSLSKLWLDVRNGLGKVDQPLLLFRSAQDHVVEPVNARIILEGVRSEDVTEQVLLGQLPRGDPGQRRPVDLRRKHGLRTAGTRGTHRTAGVVAEGGDVTRRGGGDGPEDVDAAFAEIVADLEREGLGASLIDDEELDVSLVDPILPPPATREPDKPTGWRTPETEWDPDATAEDEHFVPPEPPPLPRLRPGTIFGMFLLAVGVFLLAGPNLIGLAPRIATPLALVCLAAGIGWLVLRMRQGPPSGHDSDWDNGAQL